jgi:hypothetical protein
MKRALVVASLLLALLLSVRGARAEPLADADSGSDAGSPSTAPDASDAGSDGGPAPAAADAGTVEAEAGAPSIDAAVAPTPVGGTAPAQVEEVSVHGTREAPGATVAVVTRKDIEALPSGDSQVLSDVIATQAGVVRDVFGLELFHIHALEYGIAYVIDGIPVMYGAGESFADVIPTRLVESLHLTTSGMPVEYGANGGVVELTTRRASAQPAGDAELLYGTFDTVQTAANYSQSFGKWDVLVGGHYFSSDCGLPAPQVSPIVHDAETAGAAFGKVDFHASTHDRFELLAEWQVHDYQIPIDTTIEPLSDAPPGAIRAPDVYGNAPPVFVPYNANPTEQGAAPTAAARSTRRLPWTTSPPGPAAPVGRSRSASTGARCSAPGRRWGSRTCRPCSTRAPRASAGGASMRREASGTPASRRGASRTRVSWTVEPPGRAPPRQQRSVT